jgi:hypothetical protein
MFRTIASTARPMGWNIGGRRLHSQFWKRTAASVVSAISAGMSRAMFRRCVPSHLGPQEVEGWGNDGADGGSFADGDVTTRGLRRAVVP